MKPLAVFLALALIVAAAFWWSKSDEDKDTDETGAIETTVDYLTGKTPIEAGMKARRQLIQISIKNAVNIYEAEHGRPASSLKQLVDAGALPKQYLNDEYGRPLEDESKQGALVVRSYRVNKEAGTRTLSWEQQF